MKQTKYPILIAAALAVSSFNAVATSYNDNFDGQTLDSSKWELFTEDDNINMILDSGRLNYVRTGTPTDDDFAVLEFIATEPGYDESWEVIVDVTNTAPRSDEDQFTGAGIEILDAQNLDTTYNAVFLELGNEFRSRVTFRSNFITDDNDQPELDDEIDEGDTSGSLRISYNGTSKVFSIWVDPSGSGDGFEWQLLSSYGIAGTGGIRNTNWDMTSSGTFLIGIYGLSGNLQVSTGTVTFDNFRFITDIGIAQSWLTTYGITTFDPLSDSDKDGILDVFEAAFNLNPNSPDGSGAVLGGIHEENGQRYLKISYRRHTGHSAIQLIPKRGSSLQANDWTGSGIVPVGSPQVIDAETELVTVRSTTPIAAQNREFIRLEATYTPPAP